MRQPVLISIALCTFNGERYLHELLDSLLLQSYSYFELVIVDDASTDQTWDILQAYAARDTRIRLYRNPVNRGYNANFERALQLCKGTWIAICDQDDIWNVHKLTILFNSCAEHVMLYHDSELVDVNGHSMGRSISDQFNFYKGNDPTVFLWLNCVSGHSIFLHRSLLQHLFPIPHSVVYDQWIAYVAALHGSVHFFSGPLVKYRQHPYNATDLLGVRSHAQKSKQHKIELLQKEAHWLQECAARFSYSPPLVEELARLSKDRNRSICSLRLGWTIWKNRDSLLYLMKKNTVSKFFFVLRKTWGIPAKQIWG